MMLTVSAAGLSATPVTPLTSTALLSLADTAICADAADASSGKMRSAPAHFPDRHWRRFMMFSPLGLVMTDAPARRARTMADETSTWPGKMLRGLETHLRPSSLILVLTTRRKTLG